MRATYLTKDYMAYVISDLPNPESVDCNTPPKLNQLYNKRTNHEGAFSYRYGQLIFTFGPVEYIGVAFFSQIQAMHWALHKLLGTTEDMLYQVKDPRHEELVYRWSRVQLSALEWAKVFHQRSSAHAEALFQKLSDRAVTRYDNFKQKR